MELNVLMISTSEQDLKKADFVLKELSKQKALYNVVLYKNYEKEINFVENKAFLYASKRKMIDEFLNQANFSALILDLCYEEDVLDEVINTTFNNLEKDIIYFHEKKNKFIKFFENLDDKLLSYYSFQKNREKVLRNINSLTYINFSILKIMRLTDESYAYLQNFDVFRPYDTKNYELKTKNSENNFKTFVFPLIFSLILAFSIVLCVNLIKYFKTTNNIINLVVASFFVFVLCFAYSYLIVYNIKFKKLL